MFAQFDNKKGMGICYNNIGNVHRANRMFVQAEESYTKAIDFGVMLNDPPSIESQRTLSSRYNNLALLYLYQGRTDGYGGSLTLWHCYWSPFLCRATVNNDPKAEDMLHRALELDKVTLDYKGMITHYGNLALLKLKQTNYPKLWDLCNKYVLQVICLRFFSSKSKFVKAEEVIRTCNPTSEVLAKFEHVRKMFEETRINPTVFHNTVRLKDVFFLLDCSGYLLITFCFPLCWYYLS